MPNTRNAEIKNQMIRMQEELLLDTRKLLDQALHFNEYAVRQQKRYDRLESENAMMKYKLRKFLLSLSVLPSLLLIFWNNQPF